MKVVCAWCKKDLGEKEPLKDKSITHGICPECEAKYFPEQGGRPIVSETEAFEKRFEYELKREGFTRNPANPEGHRKIEAMEDLLSELADKYNVSTNKIANILLDYGINSVDKAKARNLDKIIQDELKKAGFTAEPKGGNPMAKTEQERKSFQERIFGKGGSITLNTEEGAAKLLPMPPDSGPPLPRVLAIRWPWK